MGRNKRYLYLDCDEARLVLQRTNYSSKTGLPTVWTN